MVQIFQSERGDVSDGLKNAQMGIVELHGGDSSVEIDGAYRALRDNHGNAKKRPGFSLRRGEGAMRRGIISAGEQQAGAFANDSFQDGLTDGDDVFGPTDAVPGGAGADFTLRVEKQNAAALSRNHIENEPEQLPLKRIAITDAANSSGNFQKCVQIASNAAVSNGRSGAPFVLDKRENGVLLRQEKGYAREGRGVLEFHRVGAAFLGSVFLKENKEGSADGDLVAVLEVLIGNGNAVDARSVTAAEITNADLGTAASKETMAARKRTIEHRHLIGGIAADRDFSLGQRESLALEWTSDAEDSRLHR